MLVVQITSVLGAFNSISFLLLYVTYKISVYYSERRTDRVGSPSLLHLFVLVSV